MITNNAELYLKCLQIEAIVRTMVLAGDSDREIIETIDNIYFPSTNEEQEIFSEAIIYAKQGVLN